MISEENDIVVRRKNGKKEITALKNSDRMEERDKVRILERVEKFYKELYK